MPRRKQHTPRKFQDLPGLFDVQPDLQSDPLSKALSDARRQQISPEHTMKPDTLIRHSNDRASAPAELEFISFGSGSSGNCSYVGIRGVGGVIVDAGVDFKDVLDRLDRNFILKETISAVLLTHDHSDHVRFAYQLLGKLRNARLVCTPRIIDGILRRHNVSKRIKEYHTPVFKEFEFKAGPFAITPFEVSHDGSDNVGYSIAFGDRRFVFTPDMGYVTDRADFYIRQADFLAIETDYDEQMLAVSRYPDYLKARIRGLRGHMSNSSTAEYLSHIWTPHLTAIYLNHLSKDNNTPLLATSAVTEALRRAGITVGDASGSAEALACQVQVYALPRFDASPLFIHRL